MINRKFYLEVTPRNQIQQQDPVSTMEANYPTIQEIETEYNDSVKNHWKEIEPDTTFPPFKDIKIINTEVHDFDNYHYIYLVHFSINT
jgi:hypothetical protein